MILGDPCGIGPELSAKLLADPETTEKAEVIVVGKKIVLQAGLKAAGVTIEYHIVSEVSNDAFKTGIVLLDTPGFLENGYTVGKVSKDSGAYQLHCLGVGLDLCKQGLADAMCFAPLNKEAMHMAGLKHEDESGFFIDCLGHTGDFGLLNTLGNLWTSRATSHISHRQVSENLSKKAILEATQLLNNALKQSGVAEPKIAIAGLNPHAGDGGTFGTEEIEIIEPAVNQAREEGINALGPFPADTIFLAGRDGKFNAIVTMYHDQGQIAMKLMGFDHGVTLHAGLAYPVTTSAHGSAFDIAGKGIASANALRAAFNLAFEMIQQQ